jgi:hypothetical protein
VIKRFFPNILPLKPAKFLNVVRLKRNPKKDVEYTCEIPIK